ncbi:MAG: glycosyl transferase family 90 [Maritimibacter sp.]
MTKAEFIDRSVTMMLGGVAGPLAQSEAGLLRALRGSSGVSVAHVPGQDDPVAYDANEKTLTPVQLSQILNDPKTRGALQQIRASGADFGFVVDMQDRRLRDVAEKGAPPYPVFCFNRHKDDTNRLLWPLPIYHDLDGDQFLADVRPDQVPWVEKEPRVVWRGITGGRAEGDGAGSGEGMRLKAALRRYRRGKLSEDDLRAVAESTPRHRTVSAVANDPRFDLGFVDGSGYVIAKTPFHAHLEKPRMPREEMQRYKYIAVLRGLDVGSSFYWVMNSGSVGFVMDTPFETFASGHFRPWEHYIPFREDASDLAERFDWAEAHPAECKAMTERAAEICTLLARADLRDKILREVIARLNAMERV